MSQSRVKALSSRVRVNAPANSFRGGWVDTFRSTVLTQLLANINQQGSSAGWTYIDYAAGPDKWDISQSVRRQWGINPVFDYGRAMSVLRHKDERAFMGHPFLGLMRRVREVNSDVVANSKALGDRTTVSKLVPGFKYFPSTAALLKPIMREQDRAILCEKDPEYFHRLATYVGNDHRFKLWNLDAYEEIAVAESPHHEATARISIPQKLKRGQKQLERYYAALEEREKLLREREPAVWEDPKLKKAPTKTPNPDVEAAKAEADRHLAAGLPMSDPAHVAFGEEIKAQNKQANDILRYLGILPMEPAPLTESVLAGAGAPFVDGAAASPLAPAPPVPQVTARREDYETQEEYELAVRITDLQRRIAEREVETFLRVQGVPTEKLRVSIERAHGLAPELFARQVEEAALTASTPASRARLDLQRTIATLEAHLTILTNVGHWTEELRTLWNELSMRIDEANDTIHNPIYERIMDEEEEEGEPDLAKGRRADPLEDYSDERLAQLESLVPLDPHTHQLYTTFQAKLLQEEDRHKTQLQNLRDEIKLLKDEQKADLDKLRAAEPLRLDEQLALADLAVLRARVVANDPDAIAEATARQRKVALAMAQTTAKEVEFARLPSELPALLGQPRQEVVTALFHNNGASRGAIIGVNSAENALTLLKDQTISSFEQLESALRPSENPRVVAARAAERKRFAELQAITQAYLKAKASGVPLDQLDAVAAPKELAAQAGAQAQADTTAHNAYLDQLVQYSRDTLAAWTKHAELLLSKGRADAVANAQKALEASVAPQQQARLKLVELTLAQGPVAAAVVEAKAEVARLDAQTNQLLEAFRAAITPVSVACHDALSHRFDIVKADVLETELALHHANQALSAAQARLAEAADMEDTMTPEEEEINEALIRIDADDDAQEELLVNLKAESQLAEAEELAEADEIAEAKDEAARLALGGEVNEEEYIEPEDDPEDVLDTLRDETRVLHNDVEIMDRRVEIPVEEEDAVDERDENDIALQEMEEELDRLNDDAEDEEDDLPAGVSAPAALDAHQVDPDDPRIIDLEDILVQRMAEAEADANGDDSASAMLEAANEAGADPATFFAWFDKSLAKYNMLDDPDAIKLAELRAASPELAGLGAARTAQVAAAAGATGEPQVEGEDDAVLPTRRTSSDDFLEDDEGSAELNAKEEARAKRRADDWAALKFNDNPDSLSDPVTVKEGEDVKLTPEEQAEFDAEAEVGEHELFVANAERAVQATHVRLAAVESLKAELTALTATTPPATPAMQAAPGTRPLTAAEEEERVHRLRYDIAKALREIATLEAEMQSDRDSINQYDFDIPMHHLHIASQRRVDELSVRVMRLNLELSTDPRDKIRLAKMKEMERPAEFDSVEFDQLSEQHGLASAQQEMIVATNELRAIENKVGLEMVEKYEAWEKVTMEALFKRADVAKEMRDQQRAQRLEFNAQLRYIQSVVDQQRAEAALLPATTGNDFGNLTSFDEMTKMDELDAVNMGQEHAQLSDEGFESVLSDLDESVLTRPGFVEKAREIRDFERRLADGQATAEEIDQRRQDLAALEAAIAKEHEAVEQGAKQIAAEREALRTTAPFSDADLAQVRGYATKLGVDADAAVNAVRTNFFGVVSAEGTIDVDATSKMLELHACLAEEMPALFAVADKVAEVNESLLAEDTEEELRAQVEADQKLDREELILDIANVPVEFRELHLAREKAQLKETVAAELMNLVRQTLVDRRPDNDINNHLTEEDMQLIEDAELMAQRSRQLAQAEVQKRIDASAVGLPDADSIISRLPTDEQIAEELDAIEARPGPTSIVIDGETVELTREPTGPLMEGDAEFQAAEDELAGYPVPEEIRFEHEYLQSMAKTEAIVRRKLLELQPLAFLDGEARVLQSRVDDMQSALDDKHNARRAETIVKWRALEDAEDADLMASLAKDATGKALSIDAIEMTMFRRRTQGLSVAALEPVLAAKRQEEVKAVYKKAGEIVDARNKAMGVLADSLPYRARPQLPPNPTPAEEREWQVQMALYNKEVAQDKRLLNARRTQDATPEAFKILRALKKNRNPELRRRQQLLASIEAEALKPVAAKASELGLELPADYEQAVIAVRSANDDVREKLFPLIIEARTLMHTLRTESLDQMRVEMQSLVQQQRELQAKLSAAKWVSPRHDVIGKELAAEKKAAAELEAQQLSEEMVLAGEMPPVIVSEQERLEAEFNKKVEAQLPAAIASLHIEERLNEIGNDPLTFEAREFELQLKARRIALEKAFPHVPKPEQPVIIYSDYEQMMAAKVAKEDKEWGVIPPEGQPAEVDSAATHFPVNIASALAKPLTAHAIIGIDIAEAITEGYGFEGDILGVDDLVLTATQQIIEQSVHRFPHATYVITYPIFGRGYQDQLLQAIMKTGVRNIIQGTFHIQKGEPFDTANRVYDFEPWGAGVAIIRPPPGFDKVLKDIVNTMQDVMIAYGPSIHTAEEQDAVASRVFPTVDAQANATFFVDRSIHWQDGWPNRPDVSWMTAQVEEHIKNLHSFRWEHFVPSYENPRSKRFELLARARSDMESDLWNYSKGYRGDDESANRWLLVNNQISTHARKDTRDTKRVPPTKELRKSKDEARLTEIMRQTAEARKGLRAQIELAQQRVQELQHEQRVPDEEAQRARYEAEAALASVEAQLKPMRETLSQRLAKVDPADIEAVALVRTEHAIQMLPLRKQKEELMARARAFGERRSDAEHARLVADAEAEVQSLEAAEQELVVDADLRAEPVVEALQREQAVARSMGIEPTQLQLDGHGRDGTKLASPPRDQSKLKPTDRYTASSDRPAIDPVDWGFVKAQQRALKRVQDADLASARDKKRVSVFNMLSSFQRTKIEQQVEAKREALAEAERIAQAKRDGTWVEEDEEAKKEEERKKRRTPALHSRMAKDLYFQRSLAKYGQKAHSQMVLPPKKQ